MLRINKIFGDSPKKNTVLTVTALADETHKRWKPLTLQRPFLLAVLLITLALLALVQVLVIQDEREEGLLTASKISQLGAFDTFLHAYLPTILAVLYSLVWSWVDLDVKRIEPYRQLSKPGGASGQDSLLLHYPYDFLGFVPFAAFSISKNCVGNCEFVNGYNESLFCLKKNFVRHNLKKLVVGSLLSLLGDSLYLCGLILRG